MLSPKNLCSELAMVSILQPVCKTTSSCRSCRCRILTNARWACCCRSWGASVIYLDKAPTAAVLLPILKEYGRLSC